MTEDGYEHPSARYRAMVFTKTPEQKALTIAAVDAAMNATFGVRKYTTNVGWIVGGPSGNGDVNKDGPQASPAWRQRVEKARRDIEAIASEHRVRMLADRIDSEEVLTLLEEIRTWANSLKRQN